MKLQKIISFVVFAIGLLGAALWFFMNSGISELMASAELADSKDLVKYPEENAELFNASIDEVSPMYNLVIIVGLILLLVTLFSVVNNLIKNPKALKKVVVNIVAFLGIILVAYLGFANDWIPEGFETKITTGGAQWVDTGLWTFYILAVLSVFLMVFYGIKKTIK